MMDRREMLAACAAIPLAATGAEAGGIAIDDDGRVPVIVISPFKGTDWTMEQSAIIRRQADQEAKRWGIRIIVVANCNVTIAPNGYSYHRSLGDYSESVTCRTKEELDEYIRLFNRHDPLLEKVMPGEIRKTFKQNSGEL